MKVFRKDSRYIIGIDLGTTNSALTYIDTNKCWDIHVFNVPQFVDDGKIKEMSVLPSFVYLNSESEILEQSPLPWGKCSEYLTGELARIKGVTVPGRLVASAKSWLCHNKVDRKDKILPFGAPENSKKISPVTASSYYLKHLASAWNHSIAKKNQEEDLFNNQHIIITIPASFDETARELTAEAIGLAGIKDFTMLEEPQAAFYSWISKHSDDLGQFCNDGDIIFIVDIGGGTADFNLITFKYKDGLPAFQRVAVGEHLMLGGDNMDIALARYVESKIGNKKLPLTQWLTLSHQCRAIKEEFLTLKDIDAVKTLSILGSGKSVIGGTINIEISIKEVKDIILEGFFKTIDRNTPIQSRAGLMELGLPYVTEPNIGVHMSSFLKRHAVNTELPQIKDPITGEPMVRADAILFNGGVFTSELLRDRTIEIINNWMSHEGHKIKILENTDLDLSVSIGASYYGKVQRGMGLSISGGLGRAYYIEVEKGSQTDSDLITVVCIIPKGLEEGQELILETPQFQVMINNPVSFTLYSSTYRVGDKIGDVITENKDSFTEMPPVKTKLHYGKKGRSTMIPVNLGVRLNEFGTIDVWCKSRQTTHIWRLSFQLRPDVTAQNSVDQSHIIEESLISQASVMIEQAFMPTERSEINLTNLVNKLSELFDLDKTQWSILGIRKVWDSLIKVSQRRVATPDHESRWLNLAGFLLRPGFGATADDWRIDELWKIYSEGLKFSREQQGRIKWWILWRRVAGGLNAVQQDMIYKKIAPFIKPSSTNKKILGSEYKEMLMLAASLEHLPQTIKVQIGEIILSNIKKSKGTAEKYLYWTLSRVGARIPFHGPMNKIVSPDVASRWIDELLKLSIDAGAYCITSLAKKTDDRSLDIDEILRDKIIKIFKEKNINSHLLDQIIQPLPSESQATIFGESLPSGLFI